MKLLATSAFIASSALAALAAQGCSSSTEGFGAATTVPTAPATADAGTKDAAQMMLGTPDDPNMKMDMKVTGEGCGRGTIKTQPGPVFFYFVADGSGSMSCSGGSSSACKRTAQENALKAIFAKFRDAKDTSLGVGMIYFGPTGSYPMSDDVDIAAVDTTQYNKLIKRVGKFPDGGTPTFEALTGAFDVLDTFEGSDPLPKVGKKVVILMSDGQPNSNETGIYQLVDRFAKRPKDPILTYSIGIGKPGDGGYSAPFMAQVAQKGKTARPGCNANATSGNFCHFQLTPGASTNALANSFVDALTKIRGEANACDIKLELIDANGQPADPQYISVDLVDKETGENPVVLEKGAPDGWAYDDEANPTSVSLLGKTCETIKNDKTRTVQVKLGCEGDAK
jgi:von Willebrand factor type A domain